jgi:hypothetical protein
VNTVRKPTVFFSHSSSDASALAYLKEQFVRKTGNSIDVFLSSDGQSIPFGRNWVHRVQEALQDASLMMVFVTPASLTSSWLYFEAGFAYAKGLRVIPIGALGIDLNNLRPPLSLLQGFNIKSADGLSNLIAVTNKEFEFSHSESFTADEYGTFLERGKVDVSDSSLTLRNHVAKIEVVLKRTTGLKAETTSEVVEAFREYLAAQEIEHLVTSDNILLPGASVHYYKSSDSPIFAVSIAPSKFDAVLSLLQFVSTRTRGAGLTGLEIDLDFVDAVAATTEFPEASSRLLTGGPFTLGRKGTFRFRGFEFGFTRYLHVTPGDSAQWSAPKLHMTITEDTVRADDLRELLQQLVQREVLILESI